MPNLWRVARPYLILTLLGGPFLWPLLRHQIPCTDDGAYFLYQAVALNHAVSNGVIFSRWLPDAAFGYGLPFLMFFEPLTRYLIVILLMMGISGPLSLNLVACLGIVLLGWGAYRLCRDVSDSEVAGLVAGVAAMSAPYTALLVYRRGAIAELFGLALLAWTLWAMQQTGRDRSAWAIIRAALLWGLLGVTHNISTMLYAPLIGGYALLVGWLSAPDGERPCWRMWSRPLLPYAAGFGLSAFFLIPAFLERNLVRSAVMSSVRNNTYYYQFVPVGELLLPAGPANPAWLNPTQSNHVGFALALIALTGLAGGLVAHRDRLRRTRLIVFGALVALALCMMTAASRPVWDAIPLLAFVQFPWRLAGLTSLFMAVLAGVGVHLATDWLARRLARWASLLAIGLACLLLIGAGLAGTYPPAWCNLPLRPSIADVHRFEADYGAGLHDLGAAFPVTVPAIPEESPLLADYAAGRTLRRFDESALPAGTQATVTYRPLGAIVEVDAPQAFIARYQVYAFPGWTVRVDGKPVPSWPDESTGLLAFDAPPGQHRIAIGFGPTPLRLLSTLISALTLAGCGIWLFVGARYISPLSEPKAQMVMPRGTWYVLGGVALVLLFARAAWPPEWPAPWRSARPPDPTHPLDVTFDGQIRLLGYDIDRDRWPADQELRLDTYWQRVASMPDRDVQMAYTVVDGGGLIWSVKGGERPRGFEPVPIPAFAWPETTYALDSQAIRLLPGTPPGRYMVTVTLFDAATLQPLTVPRLPEGFMTQVESGTIEVTWPDRPWTVGELGIQYPLDVVTGGYRLLGYNLDRESVVPGETALLTLFWQQVETDPARPDLSLWLGGQRIAPLDDWPAASPGMTWRSQYAVRIPADFGAGESLLTLLGEGGDELASLRPIEVAAVERQFDPPPIEHEVNALLGDTIRLVGLTVAPGDGGLSVELVWGAEGDVLTSYVVFIHALDADGKILAQSDTIPVAGLRPTTGWLPGEFVTDLHDLNIPADQVVRLRIGLYDPLTGIRLKLPDGSDAILITLSQ